MNNTLDVLSHAIARIVELDSMKWRDDDIIQTPQDMVKYGIVSDCEETTFEGESFCKLPNGYMLTSSTRYAHAIQLAFPNNPFDSCVAFLNSKIYNPVPEEWWYSNYSNLSAYGGGVIGLNGEVIIGKSSQYLEYGAKPELTATDVLDACNSYCKDNICTILWYLKLY